MKKIFSLFAGLVLSLVGILSFSAVVFAAPGDHITATITISNGLSYTEPGTIHFDSLAPISSGGTTEYISTGGQHTISVGMTFESELMGYVFTAATVNGSDATIVAPTHVDGDDDYHITVSEATSYTINLTAERSGPTKHTIIWANPDVKDDIRDEDMLIRNGYAKVAAVYNEHGDIVPESAYSINEGSKGGVKDGFGHVQIEAGMKVVFEFTPVYGYQLVSVKANGIALEPQKATNQYTFIMPDTNVHFEANFAKTSDVVITGSEKVSSGEITLTKNTLGAGTAQLSINDVDLDSAKIADFDKAANGMEISNVLDIDFYNVFFKGKNDSQDVWSNQIHELNEEATITLKLADDVDVSRVVIVHNIDDGDEYEIIKIESYDKEAHTITFKTKSFSNFAIAMTAGAPDTGYATGSTSATLSIIGSMLAGAVIALSVYLLNRRRI